MSFKKIALFSLSGLLIISVSCRKKGCTDPSATNYNPEAKKDDGTCNYYDTIEVNKAKFIGSWNINEIVDMDCNDTTDNETITFGCETENGLETCLIATITFANDSTYSQLFTQTENGTVLNTEEGSGTWVISNGTQITLCQDCECIIYNYIVTDTSFTFTGLDPEFGCTSTITAIKL